MILIKKYECEQEGRRLMDLGLEMRLNGAIVLVIQKYKKYIYLKFGRMIMNVSRNWAVLNIHSHLLKEKFGAQQIFSCRAEKAVIFFSW